MNIELQELSDLLLLVDAREKCMNELTTNILDKLEDNVLAVLHQLLGIPTEDVSWVDVQVLDNVLLLTCTISYDPLMITPFIQKLFIYDPEDDMDNVVHKMIRIGVPTAYIFGSIDTLFEFFNSLADSALTDNQLIVDNRDNRVDNSNSTFNISQLTDEQVQQLRLFNACNTKGDKH